MSLIDDREEDYRFAQFTPEQILASYLNGFEAGDFGILDDIKSAMHQEIALALIRAGKSKLLLENFLKFKDLDRQQLFEELIKAGDNVVAQEYAEHFPDVDFKNIGKFIDSI